MVEPFVSLGSSPRHEDHRGSLQVLYESERCVLKRSFSRARVFRGLHQQHTPFQQTKLIRVVSGSIYDFVAEPDGPDPVLYMRKLGPTDGWVLIGAHFAHGFYALEDTWFEYVCDGAYSEGNESAYSIAHILTGELGLAMPIQSEKDARAPRLDARLVKGSQGNS